MLTAQHEHARRILSLRNVQRQTPWYLQDNLRWAWSNGQQDRERFSEIILKLLDISLDWCEDCGGPELDELTTVNGSDDVCRRCLDNKYRQCSDCEEYVSEWSCANGDTIVCDGCIEAYYWHCEHCDTHHHDDDHCPNHCECEADSQSFSFPNDGNPALANDCTTTITLPAGVIDNVGMRKIAMLVDDHDGPSWIVSTMDHRWQTREGNFTKRLSKAMYEGSQFKAPAALISEIGNLAQQHSARTAEYVISVSRDLNQSAEDWGHEGSCFWGSYWKSRCVLKSSGAIGIRAWDEYQCPVGRAWVMPLDSFGRPTRDAMRPAAYVVFNCYGKLNNYIAARLIAHMTGMTYKKIGFAVDGMYVNDETGYLVADQVTLDHFGESASIDWFSENHHRSLPRTERVAA